MGEWSPQPHFIFGPSVPKPTIHSGIPAQSFPWVDRAGKGSRGKVENEQKRGWTDLDTCDEKSNVGLVSQDEENKAREGVMMAGGRVERDHPCF